MIPARLTVLVAFLAAGCGSPTTTAPSPATLLTVSPGTNLLKIGATETFSAFAVSTDGSGAPVAATWTTDNPAVAMVTAQGLATAVSAGVATITGSYQGLTATRALRVIPWYAGSWAGGYRTTACSATIPSNCMYNHAPGATGVVGVFLTQVGDQVTGFVYLDGWTIRVSGVVAITGELSLQGEVNVPGPPPTFVVTRIENWTSSIDVASQMLIGRFTHVHAESAGGFDSPAPLSNRVDSQLLNVKPIGPP